MSCSAWIFKLSLKDFIICDILVLLIDKSDDSVGKYDLILS